MRSFTSVLAAAGLAVTLSAVPAIASECPTHVKAIDEALAKGGVDAQKMTQAKQLRDEGQALHNAGNHKESMQKLNQAEKLLGIKGS